MRRSLILLISLAFLLSFLVTPSFAKIYSFTYSIFFPASHDQYKAAEKWSKAVEKETGGRVKITMFPGGTLTKAKNCYEGVVNGISDIGMSCFAYTRGRFPVMEAADLPLGYPNGKTASKTVNEFYKRVVPKELDEVKVLYIHAHGPGLLHTVKPVSNINDFKKMKIRSTGLSAKVVSALGGVPVAMSQGSTYESIKKGVVEGTFGPVEVLKGWRQGEVVKATTDTSNIGYTTSMFVVMNKKKWSRLPQDIKDIISALSEKWVIEHGNAWDNGDKAGKEYSLGLGNKFIELSADEKKLWKEKVQPVIDEYVEKTTKKAIDAKKNIKILGELISSNN